MQVEVVTDPMVRVGRPRRLFSAKDAGVELSPEIRYDVAADGSRFLMIRQVEDGGVRTSLVLARPWTSEFREPL